MRLASATIFTLALLAIGQTCFAQETTTYVLTLGQVGAVGAYDDSPDTCVSSPLGLDCDNLPESFVGTAEIDEYGIIQSYSIQIGDTLFEGDGTYGGAAGFVLNIWNSLGTRNAVSLHFENHQLGETPVFCESCWSVSYMYPHSGYIQGTSVQFSLVSPRDMLLALIDKVMSLNLGAGISNSFDSKLQNSLSAMDALNAGHRYDAENKILAFLSAVQAQRGKAISETDADQLLMDGQAIIGRLAAE